MYANEGNILGSMAKSDTNVQCARFTSQVFAIQFISSTGSEHEPYHFRREDHNISQQNDSDKGIMRNETLHNIDYITI